MQEQVEEVALIMKKVGLVFVACVCVVKSGKRKSDDVECAVLLAFIYIVEQ